MKKRLTIYAIILMVLIIAACSVAPSSSSGGSSSSSSGSDGGDEISTPVLTVNPLPNVTNTNCFDISGTASAALGIKAVYVSLTTNGLEFVKQAGRESWTTNITNLPFGTYTLNAYVVDKKGNVSDFKSLGIIYTLEKLVIYQTLSNCTTNFKSQELTITTNGMLVSNNLISNFSEILILSNIYDRLSNDIYIGKLTNFLGISNCNFSLTNAWFTAESNFQYVSITNLGLDSYLNNIAFSVTNEPFISNFTLSNFSTFFTNIENTNLLINGFFARIWWSQTNTGTFYRTRTNITTGAYPYFTNNNIIYTNIGNSNLLITGNSDIRGVLVIPDFLNEIPVTSIGNSAFALRYQLSNVTIGNMVTSIGNRAFWGCHRLTNVTIGNSVTNIEDSAFEECIRLNDVIIPDSVTHIGGDAFYMCTVLTNVTFINADCSFGGFGGWDSNFTVTAPAGGTVEAYCATNGIPFIAK